MPAVSKAQFRFMKAIESGSIKKKGLSPAKASEYTNESYAELPAKKIVKKLKRTK